MAKLLINSDRKVLASQRGKIYKAPPSPLKKLLDTTKSATRLFYYYKGTSVDDLIQYSDTSNVTNMDSVFYYCQNLTSIPLLDTSNVTNMNSMFYACENLQSIPQLNTSNVTSMRYMFYNCHKLTTVPLLNTSKVTSMESMLGSCYALQTIPKLDTSNVTNMRGMLGGCTKLQTIPQLNTSKVTDMYTMFSNCYALQTIPRLDTSNVTNMGYMIQGCRELTNIPQLNTSKVYNMETMFSSCNKLQTIDLTHMNITSTSYSSYMCSSCYSLTKFIIRNMTTIPVLNSNAFNKCYHFTGTVDSTYNPQGLKDGRIYVPDDKVEELKAATNWSVYADIIVPLSTLIE